MLQKKKNKIKKIAKVQQSNLHTLPKKNNGWQMKCKFMLFAEWQEVSRAGSAVFRFVWRLSITFGKDIHAAKISAGLT